MPIKPPFYPIVYVRGYAATMAEIEDTVATPYMGFNLGATKIRQDHQGRPVRFIFESPLIRLGKDYGYRDVYEDGDLIPESKRVSAQSVWIFRYYEQVSESLGTGDRVPMQAFAEDLREFILRIRRQVCGSNRRDLERFKVYLVAHSMGGLICRTYLQNVCVNGTGDRKRNRELELTRRPANALVDKVFTYASPHNGIEVMGVNVPGIKPLDPLQIRNFNRDAIRTYLALPPGGDRVDTLNGSFDPQRFFSFVGTNYRDYTAFFGLSRRATGPMSDGLVMIRNATVAESPRAFAHRSHSGHYGIVNSEEGYQNLRRFLFGSMRVDALLSVDALTLPSNIQRLKDKGRTVRASYNIETTARVRGATYFLHERTIDQASALLRPYDAMVKNHKPVYLFTGYLDPTAKTVRRKTAPMAFAVRVAIEVPMYEVDAKMWFDSHFEGTRLFDETILFHVRDDTDPPTVRCGLASQTEIADAPHDVELAEGDDGGHEGTIRLGFAEDTAKPPRPGFRGRLILRLTPWNA